MILGVGIDLVEVDRFRRTLERRPGLIERLFTPAEREYCLQRSDPAERFAVRFAAKEAAMKSMGVGIGAVGWHDLDVGRSSVGRPSLGLSGRAAALAADLGVERLELSLTHTRTLAQAEVIAIGTQAHGQGQGRGGRRGQVRMAQWRGEVGTPAALDPLIAGGLVPILTPAEMNAIDRDAPEPVEELIARAGAALSRHAIGMLGGTYGRRVVVIAGPGNNGEDGRDAARRLARRGVRVRVIEVGEAPTELPACDLVIDAAYGSGYRVDPTRPFTVPNPPDGTPVLAVDIPSGVDGQTGAAGSVGPVAEETLTFAALKPGLLFAAGAQRSGRITVADIGLDVPGVPGVPGVSGEPGEPGEPGVSGASAHLVGATAVAGWLGTRPVDAHKWNSAVCVVAGAPGMEGAGALASRAALRTGSGYVRLEMPIASPTSVHVGTEAVQLPTEVVRRGLPATDWAGEVLADLARFRSLVIGNGLGLSAATSASILEVLAGARSMGVPTVVDADALTVLANSSDSSNASDSSDSSDFADLSCLSDLVGPEMVLTPHDGEFARLDGGPPGSDRIAAARRLSARTGAVVLLKGPATVVAAPDGAVLVSTSGDARLATAGTGDVLAGIIGALLACGLGALHAAAAGAFIHGRAGALGWRHGSVAGDLPWRIPAVLAELGALP